MTVLDRVAGTGLVAAGAPLVVLLSGGRDSVCLLDCAVALGADVTALHVDYGLRPEAHADAAFCKTLCKRLGARLVVHEAGEPEGNVQAWARDVRLEQARRLGTTIATGHTATDQAETVLYRLAASPGRKALLGMSARDGDLVRPLLGVTREETARHCEERGLPWREDATNASDAFARNRVRHELVPALERLHPAAQRNVVRTAELLREEQEVLDLVVDTALDGRGSITKEHLDALPRAVARLVLRRLAQDAVGGLCSRVPARLDDVLALEEGALDLGDGVRVEVRRGVVRALTTPPLPGATR